MNLIKRDQREYQKRWYQNNKDKIKEYKKIWFQENKERCQNKILEWKAKNLGKVEGYKKKSDEKYYKSEKFRETQKRGNIRKAKFFKTDEGRALMSKRRFKKIYGEFSEAASMLWELRKTIKKEKENG